MSRCHVASMRPIPVSEAEKNYSSVMLISLHDHEFVLSGCGRSFPNLFTFCVDKSASISNTAAPRSSTAVGGLLAASVQRHCLREFSDFNVSGIWLHSVAPGFFKSMFCSDLIHCSIMNL
jgi:hypothetical protein